MCRHCRKTGHWAKDCEHRFNIRFMFAQEKEEWMQNLALDANTEEIEKKAKQSEVTSEEGF